MMNAKDKTGLHISTEFIQANQNITNDETNEDHIQNIKDQLKSSFSNHSSGLPKNSYQGNSIPIDSDGDNMVKTTTAEEDDVLQLHSHGRIATGGGIESDIHSSMDSDDEKTSNQDDNDFGDSDDDSRVERYDTDESDASDSDAYFGGLDDHSMSSRRVTIVPSSPSSSSSLSSSTSNLQPPPNNNSNIKPKKDKLANGNGKKSKKNKGGGGKKNKKNKKMGKKQESKDDIDVRDSLELGKDKKIKGLIRSETNSPLFSPTEFVKSVNPSTHGGHHPNTNPQPAQTHGLASASLMGFRNLGSSNLLAVQNPAIIPSGNKPLTLMGASAPPLGSVFPDAKYLQDVLDHQDNVFVVPTCSHPILDIDNLFTDVVLPSGSLTHPPTPGDGTPRMVSSASVGDILHHNLLHNHQQQHSTHTTTTSTTTSNMPHSASALNTSATAAFSKLNLNESTMQMPSELPIDLKILQLSGSRQYFNRELTELIYFYRILYEAYNTSVPVIEKLRFLAITSQNIDMYFCKRALKLRLGFISTRKSLKPEERYINMVLNTTRNLINDKYNLFNNILVPELAANNVYILKHDDLEDNEKYQLRAFFLQHVFPLMTPLVVDAGHPFPNLSNLSLNIAVVLQHDEEGHTRFVRIKVPLKIPRFVHIKQRQPYSLIPMEEIILANLDTLFPNTKLLTKCLFRVTRHYDLKLNEDDANDLLELIKTELHKRKFAPMVRLEVSSSMPKNILDMLITQLHLEDADVYIINGLLGLADLFEICKLNLPHLKFEPWVPHIPNRLVNLSKYPSQDIFSIIRKGELLVHLPYVSFNSSVQLFIESAVKDPKVLAIKIAIYRTSTNSQLIRALCEAASHKEVSVLVDLKASGDEEQNTKYARLLEQAGCHVSYGLVGLKTHCKIAMVVREEENGLREYLHYSTGNYNASTADIYVDMCLFSCDQQLGADMCDLFNYLTGYSRITSFRKLLIAPMNMRSTLIELIETEAKNAREGKEASILAVMNGLDDKRIVNALYHASVAGVIIKLVVRGRCRILPGIPGISHNIKVISILGRFLEHSRIYYFTNGGTPKAFIASADWLHRNLKRRVETLVPVEDPNNIKELRSIIDVYVNDPNSWEMLPDGRYRKTATNEFGSLASQNHFIKNTLQKHPVIWSK